MRREGTAQELLDTLADVNPDALLLEPRHLLDSSVVAITDAPEDHWNREAGTVVAVYRGESLVEALTDGTGWTDHRAALQWVESNMAGAWMGPGTWVVEWDALEA